MPSGEHKYTYIYGLVDPEDLILKYIGQSVNPIARLSQHFGDNNWIPSGKHDWMNNLLHKKVRPYIIILERVRIQDAPERETEYIKIFKETIFNTFERVVFPVKGVNRDYLKSYRSKIFFKY